MSPNHKPKKRAVSYIRVNDNTDGSQMLRSLSLQRERCQALAKQHNVEIVREFCDVGTSANAIQRPGLQQLLHHIQYEPVDYALTVGTWKLARHSRTWAAIAERLEATNTGLLTPDCVWPPRRRLVDEIASNAVEANTDRESVSDTKTSAV